MGNLVADQVKYGADNLARLGIQGGNSCGRIMSCAALESPDVHVDLFLVPGMQMEDVRLPRPPSVCFAAGFRLGVTVSY